MTLKVVQTASGGVGSGFLTTSPIPNVSINLGTDANRAIVVFVGGLPAVSGATVEFPAGSGHFLTLLAQAGIPGGRATVNAYGEATALTGAQTVKVTWTDGNSYQVTVDVYALSGANQTSPILNLTTGTTISSFSVDVLQTAYGGDIAIAAANTDDATFSFGIIPGVDETAVFASAYSDINKPRTYDFGFFVADGASFANVSYISARLAPPAATWGMNIGGAPAADDMQFDPPATPWANQDWMFGLGYIMPAEASATIVSGAASSTGAATAGFAGQAIWSVPASSTGAATAGFVGQAIWSTPASSTGAATAGFVGQAIWQAIASSVGAGVVSGTGDAIWVAVANASGTSVAAFAGANAAAPISGAASAAGTSTASFVGQAIVVGAASAAGVAAALAEGQAIAVGALLASGVADATAPGQAVIPGAMSATGTATGDFAGTDANQPQVVEGIASSTGSSSADFAGAAIILGAAEAFGVATAAFAGVDAGAVSNVVPLYEGGTHADDNEDDEEVFAIINAFLTMKRAA